MKMMWFNCFMYVGVAIFTALQTSFGSDEAAKWVEPKMLFWLKVSIGGLSAAALAAKMFFSSSYADAKAQVKQEKEETAFIKKPKTDL